MCFYVACRTVMWLVEYMYNFRITIELEVEKLVCVSLKSLTKRNTRQRDVSNHYGFGNLTVVCGTYKKSRTFI